MDKNHIVAGNILTDHEETVADRQMVGKKLLVLIQTALMLDSKMLYHRTVRY